MNDGVWEYAQCFGWATVHVNIINGDSMALKLYWLRAYGKGGASLESTTTNSVTLQGLIATYILRQHFQVLCHISYPPATTAHGGHPLDCQNCLLCWWNSLEISFSGILVNDLFMVTNTRGISPCVISYKTALWGMAQGSLLQDHFQSPIPGDICVMESCLIAASTVQELSMRGIYLWWCHQGYLALSSWSKLLISRHTRHIQLSLKPTWGDSAVTRRQTEMSGLWSLRSEGFGRCPRVAP